MFNPDEKCTARVHSLFSLHRTCYPLVIDKYQVTSPYLVDPIIWIDKGAELKKTIASGRRSFRFKISPAPLPFVGTLRIPPATLASSNFTFGLFVCFLYYSTLVRQFFFSTLLGNVATTKDENETTSEKRFDLQSLASGPSLR